MKFKQLYIYRFEIPFKYDGQKYISGYSQVCDARMTCVYAIQGKDNIWQYEKSSGIKKVNILSRIDKITFYFYSDKYYSEGLMFQGRFEDDSDSIEDRFCYDFRYFPSELGAHQVLKLKEIWR